MRLVVQKSGPLQGELRPPSDKSLTHRAYMLGAIAKGPSVVCNPLEGEDCEATLRCLAQMGLSVKREAWRSLRLIPAPAWHAPQRELDCGNSGTTMRLLAGLIASRPLEAVLTGDASLSRRPMSRIAEPLRLMGAQVEGEIPPLRVAGCERLHGIAYASPVASAQVKSCVLFAGLRAEGETWVAEPAQSRDHTERMLRAAGVTVLGSGTRVGVMGGSQPEGFEFVVPADLSSAAFWMVAAAIVPGSKVVLRQVGVNPTRTGILDVFAQSGIPALTGGHGEALGEPFADIEVAYAGPRQPFRIAGEMVPRLIDEIPVLAVLATQLEGVSTIRDASELRVKESDRIAKVAEGLRAMGAKVETTADGMDVEGPVRLRGAAIHAEGDHRIAMAFAVAGLIAEGDTAIEGAEALGTSYPAFEQDLRRLGA